MSVKFRMPPLIAIAVAGTLLVGAAAWLVAGRLHRFAYWIGRRTPEQVAALAHGRWRVDPLAVPGAQLVGLVRAPAPGVSPRWILFVPGNSTALLPGFQAELDRWCPPDVGIAFWAYRGFEASTGEPAPAALRSDLLMQYERVRSLAGAAEIEILGYSLGTPLAVQLVRDLADRGAAPQRLVLVAASACVPVMPFGLFGRFRPDDRYDCTADAGHVRCPVVLVHGEVDDALPAAGARTLAASFPSPATLHIVPAKGHVDLWPDVARLAYPR